jgi:hypothetical protein
MLLKMSILKMSSNTEIREKGECAAVRAVGQGLWYLIRNNCLLVVPFSDLHESLIVKCKVLHKL